MRSSICRIFWALTLLPVGLGFLIFIGSEAGAKTAIDEIAGATLGLAMAVIPCCGMLAISQMLKE